MLRTSLFAATAVLLGTSLADAQPQQALTTRTFSTKTTAKDLGTYHVASGTWIRPGQSGQSNIVAGDIGSLYDNTCNDFTLGFFAANLGSELEEMGDTGQIPSLSNNGLAGANSFVNLADVYTVNGWRWGVCPAEDPAVIDPNTNAPITMTATLLIFESMDNPTLMGGVAHDTAVVTGGLALPGLPAGGSSNVCYIFNVDIENTTFEFDIMGDADMVDDNPGLSGQVGDTFGVAMQLTRSDGLPYGTGGGANQGINSITLGGNALGQPILGGGMPAGCTQALSGMIAQSTRFIPSTMSTLDVGTGLGQADILSTFDGTTLGAFFFNNTGGSGGPWAGLYFELYGIEAGGAPPVVYNELCFGDGGVNINCTPCPCGNNAPTGTQGGCLNPDGRSAELDVTGDASIAADTLRVEMSGGASLSFALLISGAAVGPQNMVNPCFGLDSGIQFADGLRCAVQGFLRHGSRSIDANGDVGTGVAGPGNNGWGGVSGPPGGLAAANGFTAGQTRFFQAFYRTDPNAGCQTGQNTSQAVEVTWLP